MTFRLRTMNSFFIRPLGRLLGIALGLLVTAAHAQVSNMWTLSYPPKFSATYFDNADLTNPKVTRLDWAIDFDWNNYPYYTGSPDPTIATNTFSARWTGRVMPMFSENYTFHTVSDDGIRVWVNNQLIIDSWVDQAATEHSSAPIPLTAGVEIDIKVEYYQGPGLAVARLLWSCPSQAKIRIAYPGTTPTGFIFGNWFHEFGARMVSLGNGRFVATTPSSTEPNVGSDDLFRYSGFGWIYDQSSRAVNYAKTPQYRSSYGSALAAFPDGRFLASGSVSNRGRIYLHDSAGNLLRSWSDPDTNSSYLSFGRVIVTLPGNRFAASGVNKVYVYDSGSVAAPISIVTNPAPSSLDFAFSGANSLSGWGTNRILIQARSVDGASSRVLVFDLNGAQRAAISSPNTQADGFGNAISVIDDQRVLIGAPYAPVTYFTGSGFATNGSAGAVYHYDDTGSLLRTFTSPNVQASRAFGAAIATLGARIVIGAPQETFAGSESGRVYMFNPNGVLLATVDNPTPQANDFFGGAVTALDARRFLVGAPRDNTREALGGSIYGFDFPIPEWEIGAEIPRPSGVDASGSFATQGPVVTPADAAFWHLPSGKLFAVKPGGVLVSWPLLNNQTNNWEASLIWPTNLNRYQIHVAGQGTVDLSNGGVFSNAVLLATTAGVDANTVAQSRQFSATVAGDSFVMLSSGEPRNNPIRFQFIRTIDWFNPTHLHNNVPAVIGQPIVDPAGYQDPLAGSPQVVLSKSVYCPAPVFDPVTRTGTIIPVNRDNPTNALDDLVVAFFKRGTNLYDPVTAASVSNSIVWPWKPVRYVPAWPANPPKIVIASQQGTGAIDPALFVDWTLYTQNDSSQAGFNPNDEHALRRPVSSGEGVFALRDDLGSSATSEPYVLIRYRDPAAGLAWRIKVWRVVAEEAPFFFRYPARAGLLIQAPFPLSTLSVAPQTVGVSGPFFRDRKLSFWARAAGDDGGAAEIVMRYFYPVQPDFFFPGTNPPPLGTNIPLLDTRAGTPGVPINVRYDTTWPLDVPELRVGETLVKPKNGLPQIAGQTSVEILYQQSLPLRDGTSVRLIDPIRARTVPLAQLPADVETRVNAGLLYFRALPPHLENRLRYDPVSHQLQLVGEFVEPPAGESYLLLNVLTPRDKAAVLNLTTDASFRAAVENLAVAAAAVIPVPPDSTGFDSLALTAGDSRGVGYVTLAFGNSTNLSAPTEPVNLSVIKVSCPLYRGELKVIEPSNPLAEQLTLRHSGDFSGRPDDFEFEWRTMPPVDGLPSTLPPDQWGSFLPVPSTGIGALDITIAGPGLYTLSDNYFICRYRRKTGPAACGADWSAWTSPMLAEGWIKRVLAGIGPFEQRIQDYQDAQVNTIVSMISQAGTRAVGDVALNLNAVNSAGLIEVYETVLRRGMNLSINGAPPVDYPPANDALLLAAGRLADLYMLLGNEAYADAADPTIAFGTADGVYGSQATSLHCFMNQTASLLEEELALLRGRDSSKLPSVQTFPFYNRLIWNFTRDITGGEVAYSLNYNLRNVDGDVAGAIDEADARRLYPQGHGDAWGHYLTAIKNYYRLLRNPNFTWTPRIEAVLVGGVPVSVDYLDERKFAAAAAARTRTGAEIVSLTFRDKYVETPSQPWQDSTDSDNNRAWSLADWSSRAGQGAFFDWVTANAMLPDVDVNPAHTGIQKIERGTVLELPEIAEGFREIQELQDQADSGRNPLGLANNVVPFDIDPSAIASGKTHYEQINERANEALKNAVAVFDHANASTQLLRRQADESSQFQQVVIDREADFNNRLIEIFGTPYADDIGPTGTYPSGYAGPDLYHYDYVDSAELRTGLTAQQPTLVFQWSDLGVAADGALLRSETPVRFTFSANGFGLEKPLAWTGQRSAPGEIQMARSALQEATKRLERGVKEYENLINQIEDEAQLLAAFAKLNADQTEIRDGYQSTLSSINMQIVIARSAAAMAQFLARQTDLIGSSAVEAVPKVVGMATDALSAQRAMMQFSYRQHSVAFSTVADLLEVGIASQQDQKGQLAVSTEIEIAALQAEFGESERLVRLEQLVRSEIPARIELAALRESVTQASARYQSAVARGLRLLEERTRFRQQTAAQIQTFRYKDMAFRVFRSDALQKYRAQFDLAARYAYLAGKAYDYETCLAPGDNRGPGIAFFSNIVRSRALGRFSNGLPLPSGGTGDPGLADPLARMSANWNLVLKGQLGFNNPQTETGRFSLRNELFRVVNGTGGGQRWRETLERHVVPNLLELPEFQRHCIPFSPTQPVEPAIVIPFGTTVNFGLNFFGWPAGGGDNDYDSTKFATRIRSVGVWFANYNNLGGGMINTPRVYLVPVGMDVMRAPTQGNTYIREWRVLDQALPVPFPLNGNVPGDSNWIPINDTLFEDFASIRRFGRFRAFHDSGNFNPAETISDSRLIGRSVWNTRWLLIIPAGTLHTDRTEGIQRFINGALRPDGTRDGNGVSDIKIFFQTYAYSGN